MIGQSHVKISDILDQFFRANEYLANPSSVEDTWRNIIAREPLRKDIETIMGALTQGIADCKAFMASANNADAADKSTMNDILSQRSKPKASKKPVASAAPPPLGSHSMFPQLTNGMAQHNNNNNNNNAEPSAHWTVVQKKVRGAHASTAPTTPPASQPKYTRVAITQKISISAIIVPSFNDVKPDGNLYYIESATHFAIIIAGVLFNGNIGEVYTNTKEPQKIKDCNYAGSKTGCTKTNCTYYHNPIKCESKESRNYIASSFTYVNQSDAKTKTQCRHFGSLPNLDVDIATVTDEEEIRRRDQLMHDLLCVMALLQNPY